MKKLLLAAGILALPLAANAETYQVDPAHTYPNFVVNHLGFSDVYGRFEKTSGTLNIDKAKGTGSVEVTIDAASINTGFAKRDDHLRSPDFFNVAEFPAIKFKSTKVTFNGEGAEVVGDITIKGVTKSVTLTVPVINCRPNPMSKKPTCGLNASGKIKRSDFGINYGLPAIGDDITLNIGLEAVGG